MSTTPASTTTNNERESETVYFRFEGKPGTGVDEIDISIRRQDLTAFPDSLLTKLAEDSWKSQDNKTAGETQANPLITKPLEAPCREEWSPSLAVMIAETYRWKYSELKIIEDDQAKEGIRPALPLNVALEEALEVLEYYGLTLEDPSILRLDHLDSESEIRAKVFLKDLALIDDAKDLVLMELKQNPQRETLFIFAKKGHNMHYINTHNYLGDFHEPKKFVRIGNEHECTLHDGWVQDAFLRNYFIEQIRKELPTFDVEYPESLSPDETWCDGEPSRFEGPIGPKKGCNIATRPDIRQTVPFYEDLVVLRVRVPARKFAKRPRYT